MLMLLGLPTSASLVFINGHVLLSFCENGLLQSDDTPNPVSSKAE